MRLLCLRHAKVAMCRADRASARPPRMWRSPFHLPLSQARGAAPTSFAISCRLASPSSGTVASRVRAVVSATPGTEQRRSSFLGLPGGAFLGERFELAFDLGDALVKARLDCFLGPVEPIGFFLPHLDQLATPIDQGLKPTLHLGGERDRFGGKGVDFRTSVSRSGDRSSRSRQRG